MTFSEQYPHSTHKQDMISEAEHWWNHLTFAQREFCTLEYRNSRGLSEMPEQINQWSYKRKEFFYKCASWPETPMRSV